MKLKDYFDAGIGLGQSALCREINAHAPDMSRWVNGTRPIPEGKCVLIELHTAGESTCEENRPDLIWSRIPDPNWPHPDGRPVIDVARPADEPDAASKFAQA